MRKTAPVLLLVVTLRFGAKPSCTRRRSRKPKADMIFIHGNIYTGVVDASRQWKQPARGGHGRARRSHSGRGIA